MSGAQGVGTEEGPGVQLCLPPAQGSRQGAQKQRKGKHGAPQRHLTAGERAGKEWQHKTGPFSGNDNQRMGLFDTFYSDT